MRRLLLVDVGSPLPFEQVCVEPDQRCHDGSHNQRVDQVGICRQRKQVIGFHEPGKNGCIQKILCGFQDQPDGHETNITQVTSGEPGDVCRVPLAFKEQHAPV
jgi:hypothetical protein